eukprot:11698380-Alexandrium_andersonii.AAC.1
MAAAKARELPLSPWKRPSSTSEELKASLTRTWTTEGAAHIALKGGQLGLDAVRGAEGVEPA